MAAGSNGKTIVIFSDTHGFHATLSLPACDILIFCGDYSREGDEASTTSFMSWFAAQRAVHKIMVPGNHERGLMAAYPASLRWLYRHCPDVHFLADAFVEIDDLVIFGSRYRFRNPGPMDIPEGKHLVLVTHEPPHGVLDNMVENNRKPVWGWNYFHGGNGTINKCVRTNRPGLVCCGHCHHDCGVAEGGGTLYVNASIVTELLVPVNPYHVVRFENGVFTHVDKSACVVV